MTEFVVQALPRLPENVDVSPPRSQAYARTLDWLHSVRDFASHCVAEFEQTLDRAACQNAAAFADLRDVFDAARTAGVTLP